MKQIFKVLGITAIMLFSFYYTEKIALYAQNQNPIMKEINVAKDNLKVESVDAVVYNEYIIPGINGLEVNISKSFSKMKSFDAFNSYYLVFDQVQPDISLENNKHKIIKQGNKLKRSIAFILDENVSIKNYLLENGIKASILTTLENYQSNTSFEIINNDYTNFDKLEALLKKSKQNNNICVINKSNKEKCIEKEYYLVEYTKELNSTNIASIKKDIESGDIILINKTATLDDFKLLISQIKYHDLNIVYLSELITEENN